MNRKQKREVNKPWGRSPPKEIETNTKKRWKSYKLRKVSIRSKKGLQRATMKESLLWCRKEKRRKERRKCSKCSRKRSLSLRNRLSKNRSQGNEQNLLKSLQRKEKWQTKAMIWITATTFLWGCTFSSQRCSCSHSRISLPLKWCSKWWVFTRKRTILRGISHLSLSIKWSLSTAIQIASWKLAICSNNK